MSAAPTTDVAVVGGGLIGLSIALAVARGGQRVTVFEGEGVGRHASSASAGGVRSLNRHPAEIALVRAALPLWAGLAQDLGQGVGFFASGQLRVAEDDAALAALEKRAALTRDLGFTHEVMLDRAALFAREPGVARHCLGALLVADDGFADPLATLRAYRAAAQRAGVTICQNRPVRGLARDGGGITVQTDTGGVRANAVVNAAGAWGGQIAAQLGEPVPVEPRGLQMSVTAPLPSFVNGVIGSEGRKLSLKQMANGTVVIGGAYQGNVDASARMARPLQRRVAANLATAAHLFPALAPARIIRSWAGIEGWSQDALPVIGPSKTMPGVIHAFGFSGHGFALVPLIGPLVAQMLMGKNPTVSLTQFDISRFSNREEDVNYA
ncbi:NAD(P)/FAD-dependent oxidoreductase [Oceaniglobus ichthyenteri]|uniref:NAD(P)/FAD-dependent oxidoreductase n=1 Tax=Oceaniglobus ichthyenteri TaxID=2136177 RepID=UPI0013DD9504|nr:FAD-dependent oxidoreductase [Oceaniglobus ichthyenteri]